MVYYLGIEGGGKGVPVGASLPTLWGSRPLVDGEAAFVALLCEVSVFVPSYDGARAGTPLSSLFDACMFV